MGLLLPSCVGVWGWNSGFIISIGMCFCTDRDVLFGQHEFSVGIGYCTVAHFDEKFIHYLFKISTVYFSWKYVLDYLLFIWLFKINHFL